MEGSSSAPTKSSSHSKHSSAETVYDLVNSISRIIESSLICPSDVDPFVSNNESTNHNLAAIRPMKISAKVPERDFLQPSPLKIRKASAPVVARDSRADNLGGSGSPMKHRHYRSQSSHSPQALHLNYSLNPAITQSHGEPSKVPRSNCLQPPPLKICKVFPESDSHMNSHNTKTLSLSSPTKAGRRRVQSVAPHRPPALPLRIIPSDAMGERTQDSKSLYNKTASLAKPTTYADFMSGRKFGSHGMFPMSPFAPNQAASIMRFNSNVSSLQSQIHRSITALRSLINEVKEIQRVHRAMKASRVTSFWSFSPIKEGRAGAHCREYSKTIPDANRSLNVSIGGKETKQQRIERLRAEGWNTIGIKSNRRGWKGVEYYRSFCNSALDELYLDHYEF